MRTKNSLLSLQDKFQHQMSMKNVWCSGCLGSEVRLGVGAGGSHCIWGHQQERTLDLFLFMQGVVELHSNLGLLLLDPWPFSLMAKIHRPVHSYRVGRHSAELWRATEKTPKHNYSFGKCDQWGKAPCVCLLVIQPILNSSNMEMFLYLLISPWGLV